MSRTITDANYTDSMAPPLQNDERLLAIGKSVSSELLKIAQSIEENLIYSRIDQLPEEIIDILAFDFHVDWYDYRLPLETKREMLKNSVRVHRYLGTRYSVETVLKEVYADATIVEWFETEPKGAPYTFKLDLDVSATAVPKELQVEILKRIYFYKNLRSHMEGIIIRLSSTGTLTMGGYATVAKTIHIDG